MRKFISALLCAFLLTSSLVVPVLAQDSPLTPPVLCGDLDEADCGILESSSAAMQDVTSYAFSLEYHAFLTGLPDMDVETVDITFGADGTVAIDPEVVATIKSLSEASMSGAADAMTAAMEEMPAAIIDLYGSIGFDGEIHLSMPEELAAILSEDSEVPMPAELSLAFRIVDGMFYMEIADLKAFAPDLEEIEADWIGFDLVGLMEQSLAQSSTATMDQESMAQSMVAAGLANQIVGAMEPYVTVERLDNTDIDGQTAAVFQSSVDMVGFFSSDEFINFVRDSAAAVGADDEATTAQLDEGLTMMSFIAPMIFGGMEINNVMTIGLDDFYLYAQDFVFNWDLSQLLGFAAMSDPSIAEALGDAEPVIEFTFTNTFDQFNEDFEFAAPDSVQIIPLDEMSPMGEDAVF